MTCSLLPRGCNRAELSNKLMMTDLSDDLISSDSATKQVAGEDGLEDLGLDPPADDRQR
eukprot:m.818815 g.818815  ORF g.818815 m.818815 type:complete len:59 (-) comp59388_c0_seq126:2500-2676(-)